MQVEHVEEGLSSKDAFMKYADGRIGECPEEIVDLFFKIVTACLQRHSKRPTSEEVSFIKIVSLLLLTRC